ncbi:MAG: hypothetical protein ACE5DW_05995, partial [Thermodesulfobacteriota bacterium]
MLNILLAIGGANRGLIAALQGHKVHILGSDENAEEAIVTNPFDVAIVEGGLLKLNTLKKRDPRVEVILLGSEPSMAIQAIREGASAFFTPPLPVKSLKETVLKIDNLNKVR